MEKTHGGPGEWRPGQATTAHASSVATEGEPDTERVLLDAVAKRRAASRTAGDERAERLLGFAAIVVTAIILIGIVAGFFPYVQ